MYTTARQTRVVNLIDYRSSVSLGGIQGGVALTEALTVVFVNPTTMLPANRVKWEGSSLDADYMGNFVYFFSNTGGFRSKPSPLQTLLGEAAGSNYGSAVGGSKVNDGVTGSAYLDNAFGVRATSSASNMTVLSSVAVTAPNAVATQTQSSAQYNFVDNGRPTFGVASGVAAAAAGNTIEISRDITAKNLVPSKFITRNGQRQGKSQTMGHFCYLYESYDCYRNGVWQSWETPHSWLMQFGRYASGTYDVPVTIPNNTHPATSPAFLVQNDLTGARTVTLRFYTGCNYDLTDEEVWIDVFYANSSTSNAYVCATSMNSNYGAPWAAGNALTRESSSTWTEVTNVYQGGAFAISVPITIGRATPILVKVSVATPHMTGHQPFGIYIDPNITVT